MRILFWGVIVGGLLFWGGFFFQKKLISLRRNFLRTNFGRNVNENVNVE